MFGVHFWGRNAAQVGVLLFPNASVKEGSGNNKYIYDLELESCWAKKYRSILEQEYSGCSTGGCTLVPRAILAQNGTCKHHGDLELEMFLAFGNPCS